MGPDQRTRKGREFAGTFGCAVGLTGRQVMARSRAQTIGFASLGKMQAGPSDSSRVFGLLTQNGRCPTGQCAITCLAAKRPDGMWQAPSIAVLSRVTAMGASLFEPPLPVGDEAQ